MVEARKTMRKKSLSTLCGLLLMMSMTACGRPKNGGNWYDTGNGMVNLDQVTHISSQITLVLILAGEESPDGESPRSVVVLDRDPLNPRNIDKAIAELVKYQGQWKNVRYGGVILLDNFTMGLPDLDALGLDGASGPNCMRMLNAWLKTWKTLHARLG